MREEWKTYWRQFFRYRRYVLWGLLLALVPFGLNASRWRERDAMWLGLAVSLGMSLSITLMIFIFIGGFYAILTVLRIRTGLVIKRMPFFEFVLVGLGIASGVVLGRLVSGVILHEPVTMSAILPTLILSGLGGLGFALHIAYRNAKEDALALRTVVAESKYNLLEQQMRPHFLFNSLNSLAELIESGHERAAEVTHGLADIYRLILANSRIKTAPLDSELEIVRRYLELEKLRFGERLNYSITAEPEAERAYVPSLMIQTLIENCVKHGIARSSEPGSISLAVTCKGQRRYRVEVENTAKAPASVEMTGTGLRNTRERLDLLYGTDHEFNITVNEAGRVTVGFYFSGERID